MSDIQKVVRASKSQEVDKLLQEKVEELEGVGYRVEFGKIGVHTTYVLLTNSADEEIVGYTYLRDMKYYKENVGKLKALQQAIARKDIKSSEKSSSL